MPDSRLSPERIYLDYAATTPIDEYVVAAMQPYLGELYGNANALYREGRTAFLALEQARADVTSSIGARMPREVIATSGGTESNNTLLFGVALAAQEKPNLKKRRRIIVSSFEHHAVLAPAERLKRFGFYIDHLAPRNDGRIHPEDLAACIGSKRDVLLVSIMTVNNELGTVQPVKELADIAHQSGAVFHTDAVQALGKIPFNVRDLDVDAASLSSHKVYGPKGVGALYIKEGTPFMPLILGGGQEGNRRSGTSNVAGLVGFAAALKKAISLQATESARLQILRDHLLDELQRLSSCPIFPTTTHARTGETPHLIPHIVPCLFPGYESETLVQRLDARGICVSGGSACSSHSLEPSHVMKALNIPNRTAQGLLRISLGRPTTTVHVDTLITTLAELLEKGVD
jgi:cysteine desulfurase